MLQLHDSRRIRLFEVPNLDSTVERSRSQAAKARKEVDVADEFLMTTYLFSDCGLMQINLVEAVVDHGVVETIVVLVPGNVGDRPLHLLDELLGDDRSWSWVGILRAVLDVVDA